MPTLADALRYQEELAAAERAATVNENMLAQGRKMNLPSRQAYAAPDPFAKALPMEGRAAFLPYRDTMPGSVMNTRSVATPGILASALNAFTAPGRALSGSDPTFNPEEEAMNVGLTAMGGGGVAGRGASGLGMNVWHGSPHRFAPTKENPLGAFDAAKIGSGEGAQAYGYGHYLAVRIC